MWDLLMIYLFVANWNSFANDNVHESALKENGMQDTHVHNAESYISQSVARMCEHNGL